MSVDDRTTDTNAATVAPSATGPREERVSIVSGDRFCTQCGYNLVGQSVLREPHYQMFIVRCPECATVAALQEYPLLGKWASRWAVLFAILFIITLMGAWTGSSAALFGMSIGSAEDAARGYTRYLQDAYENATAIAPRPQIEPGTLPLIDGSVPPQIITQIVNQASFSAWWEDQDHDAMLAARGGWFAAIDPRAFWFWLPGSIAAFVIGTFWAVALLNVRRRYLPLWAIPLLMVAAAFCWIEIVDWVDDAPSRAWRAGRGELAPAFALLTLVYLTVPLVAGLLLGRSFARLLVRALLPPRLRYALALLWRTDGLVVPGVRGKTER